MPSIHLSKSSNVIFTLGGDDEDDKDGKSDEYYKIEKSEKPETEIHIQFEPICKAQNDISINIFDEYETKMCFALFDKFISLLF
jgi:hypothetical protein